MIRDGSWNKGGPTTRWSIIIIYMRYANWGKSATYRGSMLWLLLWTMWWICCSQVETTRSTHLQICNIQTLIHTNNHINRKRQENTLLTSKLSKAYRKVLRVHHWHSIVMELFFLMQIHRIIRITTCKKSTTLVNDPAGLAYSIKKHKCQAHLIIFRMQ